MNRHIEETMLRRALAAVVAECGRYWCWVREEYEKADRLRCELLALLGEPAEPRPWPE